MSKNVRGAAKRKDQYHVLSNYCGLGDSEGKPTMHAVDKLCKAHDRAYERMLKKGQNPYTQWNPADQKFFNGLQELKAKGFKEAVVQYAAKMFFSMKKRVASEDSTEFIRHYNENVQQSSVRDHFISEIASKGASAKVGDNMPRRTRDPEEGFVRKRAKHDHEEDHTDGEMSDDPNTPTPAPAKPAAMTTFSSGNGRRTAGQETPITRAPTIAHPGFTDTQTVSISYNVEWSCILAKGSDKSLSWKIRTTSINDPFFSMSTVARATVTAGNSAFVFDNNENEQYALGFQTATSQPVWGWKPYYAELYQKYAVLGCHYDVSLKTFDENRGNEFNVSMIPAGPTAVPSMGFADKIDNHKWNIKRIRSNRGSTPHDRSQVHFKGYYRPGDFGEEVVTDALAETWTDFSSNPTLEESLQFQLAHASDYRKLDASANHSDIIVKTHLKYIVQFKGLKDKWRHWRTGVTDWAATEAYGRYP
jgi:hypothetical protein